MAEALILLRVALGLLGAALIVTSVCRLQHMTAHTTLARVRRAAEAVLAAGALMVLAATLRPDWTPAALLASPVATLAWMAATSHAWRNGQPLSATRGGAVLRRVPRLVLRDPPRFSDTVPLDREQRRTARG